MPEAGQKKKMSVDRYVELFNRYTFEEMTFIVGRLKEKHRTKAEIIRDDLEVKLNEINNHIQ